MLKKIISILLVTTIIFCAFSMPSFAKPVNDTYENDEYFEFAQPSQNERIDSNGNYTYRFHTEVRSDSFKPTRTSITITSITSTTSNSWFRITLYEYVSSGDDKEIGYISCKDDGLEDSKTFTGLKTNATYYLVIRKTNWLNSNVVVGNGHITNITVV